MNIKNFEKKVYEGKWFDIYHVWKYQKGYEIRNKQNEFFDYQRTLQNAKQILKDHEQI